MSDKEKYRKALEARIGVDRMAMGLACLPDKLRGDMDLIACLRAELEAAREDGKMLVALWDHMGNGHPINYRSALWAKIRERVEAVRASAMHEIEYSEKDSILDSIPHRDLRPNGSMRGYEPGDNNAHIYVVHNELWIFPKEGGLLVIPVTSEDLKGDLAPFCG